MFFRQVSEEIQHFSVVVAKNSWEGEQLQINPPPFLLIYRQSDLNAFRRPIEMGKKIVEGFQRNGLRYGEQSRAVVILDEMGRPKTAYTDFD